MPTWEMQVGQHVTQGRKEGTKRDLLKGLTGPTARCKQEALWVNSGVWVLVFWGRAIRSAGGEWQDEEEAWDENEWEEETWPSVEQFSISCSSKLLDLDPQTQIAKLPLVTCANLES